MLLLILGQIVGPKLVSLFSPHLQLISYVLFSWRLDIGASQTSANVVFNHKHNQNMKLGANDKNKN